MFVSLLLLVPWILPLVVAIPTQAQSAVVKRPDELLDEYDFIVVGAGTAGLTVADRLSENGNYTVLAVEYGWLDTSPDIVLTGPGSQIIGINSGLGSGSRFYNLSSEPLRATSGEPWQVSAGCIVGGSSAVNGMVFDRGSAEDYDSWVWSSGEKHQEQFAREWGWNNLLPWFKKSVTFHPPSDDVAMQYGMTYDLAAYGGNTPIHSSYPPFQWPGQKIMWEAFKTIPGVEFPKEHAGGDAVGVVWIPSSIEPVNRTRSYAKLGHFDANGVSSRENFHLLPGYRVTQLDMTENVGSSAASWIAKGVFIVPRSGAANGPQKVKARREIIVSAGSVHTPQVLQRSGIGPKDVLDAADVKLRVELPGVGANLQDHAGTRTAFRWTKQVLPDDSMLISNKTYADEAMALWKTNRTGPLSAYFSSMALVPLQVLTNKSNAIVEAMLAQDPVVHLPNGTHPTVMAGYAEQVKALARQYKSRRSAVLEMPFSGKGALSLLLLKPLSRGRVRISPKDDGVSLTGRGDMEPILDWRTMTNPLDVAVVTEFVRWARIYVNTTAIVESFAPVETLPGADIASQDAIEAYVRKTSGPSNGHMVGTAALAPRELGGVVGPDLKVYGTQRLSVADNSIITLIPGTHTSSTAYAIGEKAASMVLRRAQKQLM